MNDNIEFEAYEDCQSIVLEVKLSEEIYSAEFGKTTTGM